MENKNVNERHDRLKKLSEMIGMGIDPYPAKTDRSHEIIRVISDFENLEASKTQVCLTGRIKSIRGHGNLTFCNLADASGIIQIALSKKEIGDEKYNQFNKFIDISDFIEIKGYPFVTHKGEKSIMATDWSILSKTLRPLPDQWYGFKDEEERLRKRYLDILSNPEIREMVIKRDIFWNSVRTFLKSRGFLEVETPVLEVTTGGADAKPFITHYNALDMDVYLRISMGELWQKRLMVAGFEKTFEIGRQFRNEGLDAEHLQDYSQMEFYWAYADYLMGMELVEDLFKHVAKETFGTHKFKIGKFEIDLGAQWQKYDYRETVMKYTGIDIMEVTLETVEKKLHELGIEYDKKGFNITRAIDNLWKYCRKQIPGPGFLVNEPLVVSPLAKKSKDNPELVQRFHVILAGSELGNGYSELNDPLDQVRRFEEQVKLREQGDEEAQMYDHDFVEALEYGMPPTCGFGMSERLFAFLMDKNMRECQIFPLMKPKEKK
jgi:lysyl-tRNA synthetase class 2